MADWLFWLIAAGALGVAEMLTLTLVLGMLAVAAVVASVVAGVGAPVAVQVAGFAGGAIVLLGVARPIARSHLRTPQAIRTGVAALIGTSAIALTEVTEHGGRVRLKGEEWTARCYDRQAVIPAGARVDVIEIDGATAVVLPQEPT